MELVVQFRESRISSYHNYLINEMLTPGFLLGEQEQGDDFWLLADVLQPGERKPYLSGRLYGPEGDFLLRLRGSEIVENPGNCLLRTVAEGFRLLYPSGEELLALYTELFANGSVSRIQGRLYDRERALRMAPSFESARVFGALQWMLERPLRFRDRPPS